MRNIFVAIFLLLISCSKSEFDYKTKDNYMITSSNKELILDSLHEKNNLTSEYYNKLDRMNSKIKKNIFLRKKSQTNLFLHNKFYLENDDDIIATTFEFKDKELISKSYLINDNKNIDISSYKSLTNKNDKSLRQSKLR